MNIIDAIYAAAYGYTIKSCEGNTYTEAQLNPRLIGNRVVSYNHILTESERKGRWEIVSEEDDACTD